ncbi:MAG: 5-carboxymethyl-2-hydroxymuconate isomerase [Halieaceae bacterium]
MLNLLQGPGCWQSTEDFIHVFAHIMQDRREEQKAGLSKNIITRLVEFFFGVPNIAINVSEFEKATYCNRAML